MFRHLLVPTDGSDLSTSTVERAVSFARETGANITFMFSKPEFPVAMFSEGILIDPVSPARFEEAAAAQAADILKKAVDAAATAGVAADSVAKTSDMPYEAIIAAAEEKGCDLIFMASHGRRGISAVLLGSETQKVLTHSKIPVLVYR
ncbi:MAG: universal stress protein [Rhodocyclaceae bacterium]|nr:universal stress protein [Rhodocyclaceae bacterium]MBX3666910.1 universal stress protein [Rhodocyclaceae bacterium]